MKDLRDLFIYELRDIYSAGLQIMLGLPEFVEAAQDKELKEAFEKHLREAKIQVERVVKIAKNLNVDIEGRECDAVKAIINEARKVVQTDFASEVKDAALISCAQRIEHYEIAVYGTLKSFGHYLEFEEINDLLKQSCLDAGNADKELTKIAKGNLLRSGVNKKAVSKPAAATES